MPMLTTPDRSYITPHSAAERDRDRDACMMIGAMPRQDRDEVADELEDEPEDRDPVQMELVHQRIVASPP